MRCQEEGVDAVIDGGISSFTGPPVIAGLLCIFVIFYNFVVSGA